MSEHAITLDSVTVRKTRTVLLESASLHVTRGELVGVIGPNGAGKTTLLNVIAGFEKFEGVLSIFGRPETHRRSRESHAFASDTSRSQFPVDPTFPILAVEAVMTGAIGRTGLFRSPGRRQRRSDGAHGDDAPCPSRRTTLGQLSGGERQKVSTCPARSSSARTSSSWTNRRRISTSPCRRSPRPHR